MSTASFLFKQAQAVAVANEPRSSSMGSYAPSTDENKLKLNMKPLLDIFNWTDLDRLQESVGTTQIGTEFDATRMDSYISLPVTGNNATVTALRAATKDKAPQTATTASSISYGTISRQATAARAAEDALMQDLRAAGLDVDALLAEERGVSSSAGGVVPLRKMNNYGAHPQNDEGETETARLTPRECGQSTIRGQRAPEPVQPEPKDIFAGFLDHASTAAVANVFKRAASTVASAAGQIAAAARDIPLSRATGQDMRSNLPGSVVRSAARGPSGATSATDGRGDRRIADVLRGYSSNAANLSNGASSITVMRGSASAPGLNPAKLQTGSGRGMAGNGWHSSILGSLLDAGSWAGLGSESRRRTSLVAFGFLVVLVLLYLVMAEKAFVAVRR